MLMHVFFKCTCWVVDRFQTCDVLLSLWMTIFLIIQLWLLLLWRYLIRIGHKIIARVLSCQNRMIVPVSFHFSNTSGSKHVICKSSKILKLIDRLPSDSRDLLTSWNMHIGMLFDTSSAKMSSALLLEWWSEWYSIVPALCQTCTSSTIDVSRCLPLIIGVWIHL